LPILALILLCLFACPLATCGQENPDWISLVEAERAFAAASLAKGTRVAFLEFLAEDSILFRPGPVPGRKWIEEHPAPSTLLTWEPTFADVAQSGDLGYTTGPWEIRSSGAKDKPIAYGDYVSVWKRRTDGVWKVMVDLGISHAASAGNSKTLQPSNLKGGSEKARRNNRIDEERSELLAFDRELANSISEKGSAQAYLRYLADDARLYRAKTFPVVGKREIFAILSQRLGRQTLRPDKADISNAADLGYTFGTSRSMVTGSGDAAGTANYVHIWKRRGNRWTLVLDVESPISQQAATQ
jgi:ketosteroid isomerase-like protein